MQFALLGYFIICVHEEFEDTKGLIRTRKSKDRQNNGKNKKYERTKIRSTKLKIE